VDFDRPELAGGEVPSDGMSSSVLPIIPHTHLAGSRFLRRALGMAVAAVLHGGTHAGVGRDGSCGASAKLPML
jgi:hypothetical protein